jgi:protein phosphatase 1A
MGNYLPKPMTDKECSSGAANGFTWSAVGMQGWRTNMEDAHITLEHLDEKLKTWSLFAVFDGHSGNRIAEISSKEFPAYLMTFKPFTEINDNSEYNAEEVKNALEDAFLKWDEKIKETDQERRSTAGATVTGVLIAPNDYFFFNIGDSRSFVVRESKVFFTTVDHKPTNQSERERIESGNGMIKDARVNGQLAVSRALGDYEFKNNPDLSQTRQLVSPQPDIDIIKRDISKDEFILIACDGVFDVNTNEQVLEYVDYHLKTIDDDTKISSELVGYSLYRGSKDNMSAILISFDKTRPKKDEAKVKELKEIEEKLEHIVTEYTEKMFQDERHLTEQAVIEHLSTNYVDLIEKLPEQFGKLRFKQDHALSVYNKVQLRLMTKRRQEQAEKQAKEQAELEAQQKAKQDEQAKK